MKRFEKSEKQECENIGVYSRRIMAEAAEWFSVQFNVTFRWAKTSSSRYATIRRNDGELVQLRFSDHKVDSVRSNVYGYKVSFSIDNSVEEIKAAIEAAELGNLVELINE